MANPLARVVMKNLVDKKKREGMSIPKSTPASADANLSSREENLLLGLMGTSQKGISGLKSLDYKSLKSNKSTYKTGAASAASGLRSLESLAGVKSSSASSSAQSKKSSGYGEKVDYGQKTFGVSSAAKVTSGVKAISLDQLSGVKSDSSSSFISKPARQESVQQSKSGGMMSLDQLAGNKVGSASNDNGTKSSEANKPSVKARVISSLEGYVPKVSLDSIGKKNSLF